MKIESISRCCCYLEKNCHLFCPQIELTRQENPIYHGVNYPCFDERRNKQDAMIGKIYLFIQLEIHSLLVDATFVLKFK